MHDKDNKKGSCRLFPYGRKVGLLAFMERTSEMIKDEAEKILTRANMSLK